MQEFAKKVKIRLRRWLKRAACVMLLAPCYYLCCLFPVQKGLAVLADGHQDGLPYSMRALRLKLMELPHIKVVEYFRDYSFSGPVKGLWRMLCFMPLYARAEFVFICNSFVPTTCCRKRKGTTVVQLWHSCGLMKKVGVDSPEDAEGMMKTQFRNTDVFTASAPVVADVLSQALMIPRENFSEAGVGRMDLLYNRKRVDRLREYFYENHPEYLGKKLVLWAPTFRGNVHDARLEGEQTILKLQQELGDEYAILIKTHRVAGRRNIDTPVVLTSEQLVAVVDCLITDYSSMYFDYLYFRKPVILFAPDLEEYVQKRGIYPEYREVPGFLAEDEAALRKGLLTMDSWADDGYRARLDQLWQEQMTYCDGHSTEKLLLQLGIMKESDMV